tara:strand:- start:817 stop:1071 length:255 start_codon:yes stop_codon:yes gene_type:complete
MKEKNLPHDIQSKSVEELTDLANNIIENLESKNNLDNSIEDYQMLIKLNVLIERKFQKNSKKITEITKEKIKQILKKDNGKKIK